MAPDGHKYQQNEDAARVMPGLDSISAATLQSEARAAADFLKALGHDGRLLMLYHLCERDLTVTELEQLIMSRQAAVSQQLARLRLEKLVTTRRDGNQIIYSLSDQKVRDMVCLIQRLFRPQR